MVRDGRGGGVKFGCVCGGGVGMCVGLTWGETSAVQVKKKHKKNSEVNNTCNKCKLGRRGQDDAFFVTYFQPLYCLPEAFLHSVEGRDVPEGMEIKYGGSPE